MHNEIQARAERAIREKVFPGCIIGVVKKNSDREMLPYGTFTYELGSQSVTEDTIYDLASVTKSIPTASLALTLISEGKLRVRDAVRQYLPELKNDYGATIGDLLTYRVQGARLSELRHETSEEIRTHILESGFSAPPGEGRYTNLPAYILGLILERVGGSSLALLSGQYFFEPLEMKDTTFFPDVRPTRSNIAPTEIIDGEEIRGIVHDESARVFAKSGQVVGHAGLFSTAPDILNFFGGLLRGAYPQVVDGAEKGLGWQKAESWFAGSRAGNRAFGKTGFTGTSVFCDVERGIAYVILSNRTYPKRPPDATSMHSAVNAFRADIADILLR